MKIVHNGAKNAYEKQELKNLCDDLGKIMAYHIVKEVEKTIIYGDNK